ncbi:MAG TPA: acetate/propionate family kinase [Streptosporangiaceae bacterium]
MTGRPQTGPARHDPGPGQGAARVLVVNAGSSSLKLSVIGPGDEVAAQRDIDRWDGSSGHAELRGYLSELAGSASPPDAVGHRVVHGADRYTAATLIDEEVRSGIGELASLAPLHQPRALAGLDAAAAALPGVPQVACFDTAFHATLPPAAYTYPLPAAWRERYGLRKFGFHGLSHAYASRRAAELLRPADPAAFRIVTCHLGSGASLAAVRGGRSVETTMGFTPVDGLVMATRPGSVDPGLIAWLAAPGRVAADDLASELEHGSGLAGLAGGAGDMREVLAAAAAGQPAARLAFGVHAHRLTAAVAAMAAAMNGLDALVFTGGIGEHVPEVRAAAAAGLAFLGVAIDDLANATAAGPDRRERAEPADISAAGAPVRTLVLAAREDLEIARAVRGVLAG